MKLQGILLKIFLFALQAMPMMGGMDERVIGNNFRGSGCLIDVFRDKRSPIRNVENKCSGLACGNLNVDLSRNKRSPMDEVQRSCLAFACANVNNGASIVKRGIGNSNVANDYRGAGCIKDYISQNASLNTELVIDNNVGNNYRGAGCTKDYISQNAFRNKRSPVRDVENSCKGTACTNVNVDLFINRRSPMYRAKNSCTGFSCLNTSLALSAIILKVIEMNSSQMEETFRRQILMKKM